MDKCIQETFIDLLQSGRDFDCELIIDNSEMSATFVWDEESHLTDYGAQYYAELLGSPCEILDSGNIEIFCDNYELGEHFVMAAAGYIGISEYNKLFGNVK